MRRADVQRGCDKWLTCRRSYCVKTLWGHDDWVRSVAPSDDGRWLVSASSDQVSVRAHAVEDLRLLTIKTSQFSLRRLDFGTEIQANQRWN